LLERLQENLIQNSVKPLLNQKLFKPKRQE